MIGEIRDLETAQIAIQSALTGHLVLSTLHTNNAAGAVTRLLDMGVDDYLITSTVNAVVGQRLVRLLCTACRQPYTPSPELVARLGLGGFADTPEITLYRAVGCEACDHTGYVGRAGIFEILVLDDNLRDLILKSADSNALHRAAVDAGMRTMYEDGLGKVLAGRTAIEEILRVTRASEARVD